MTIAFTKVKLPYGWLGNMAPYPVQHEGQWWPTTEHLFQALRFSDRAIRERIRAEPNPFVAKLVAKRHQAQMVVARRSRRDVANIERVLRLKLKFHPVLRDELLAKGDQTIIEDCSSRPGGSGKFWGAAWQDGQWVGENVLGQTWMKLRSRLRGGFQTANQNGYTIEDVRTLKRVLGRLGADQTRNLIDLLARR